MQICATKKSIKVLAEWLVAVVDGLEFAIGEDAVEDGEVVEIADVIEADGESAFADVPIENVLAIAEGALQFAVEVELADGVFLAGVDV